MDLYSNYLTAVDSMSLDVRRGQVVGLIGPNGAGKTTFFNALSGHQPIGAGVIRLLGTDVTPLSAHQRARMGLARTFQLGGLIADLTALENVVLGLDHMSRCGERRIRGRELRASGVAFLERFGLLSIADEVVAGLPAGIKREIEVARAFASSAKLLLLDEPGAGLTAGERQRLSTMVRGIAAMDTSFIITDHSTDLVFSASDKVAVMNFGQLVTQGDPVTIRSDPAVMEAYLGSTAVKKRGTS